jgi:hypothetical protein
MAFPAVHSLPAIEADFLVSVIGLGGLTIKVRGFAGLIRQGLCAQFIGQGLLNLLDESVLRSVHK